MSAKGKYVDPLLMRMLQYKRPAWSATEEIFIDKFLMVLPGAHQDDFGNVLVEVGDNPNIMWSAHTDTVHHKDGIQGLRVNGPWITPITGKKRELSNCLGADDTAGIWLMVKMIEANIPGLYIFHRAEEVGGLGSKHIASKTPEVVESIDYCIALDRKDYTSVITHQRGTRCCSADFADSLCGILGSNDWKPDRTGVFTDSANYTDLIGECTNLSVGYFAQHGPAEKQNWLFLQNMLEILIAADWGLLIAKRKPGEADPDKPVWKPYSGAGGSYVGGGHPYKPWQGYQDDGDWVGKSDTAPKHIKSRQDYVASVEDFCYQNYASVAEFFEELGITLEDLEEYREGTSDAFDIIIRSGIDEVGGDEPPPKALPAPAPKKPTKVAPKPKGRGKIVQVH